MEKPFVFGMAVKDDHFVGRERELTRLQSNIEHGVNTILMSPRRIGKTSLVKKVINDFQRDDIRIVYMDIFSCRSEYDFYNIFSEAVLHQTESKFDEWKSLVSDFMLRLTPKVSFFTTPENDYSVSLGITPKTHKPEEILNLPEQIAQKKNIHIVICIDEFQQIGEMSDSISIQKRMRTVWQHQEHVSYCLFGSKKHMMESMFLKSSYPFYKFGDIIPIDVIPTATWIPYIQSRFAKNGKTISSEIAAQLCDYVENHSAYVQQLAWLTFLNTENQATEQQLQTAEQELINEVAPVFMEQVSGLTEYQLNFMKAMLAGVVDEFGKTEIREQFNLGSYSNIIRIKTALLEKELITVNMKSVKFTDPLFPKWFSTLLS